MDEMNVEDPKTHAVIQGATFRLFDPTTHEWYLYWAIPKSGKLDVLGLNVAQRPLDVRARLGYMPETDGHIPGMNAVTFVAYNTLFGLTSPGIDNAAHLGGLATGFVGGLLLQRPWPPGRGSSAAPRRLLAAGGLAGVLALSYALAAGGMDIAPRVREALAQTTRRGDVPSFTASYGIAESTVASDFEDLLHRADRALFAAKEAGRDCICIDGHRIAVAPNLTAIN